jgi:hypothetical protein
MQNRKRPLPPLAELLAEARRIYAYGGDAGGLVWREFRHPHHPGQAKLGEQVGGDDGLGYRMCMLLGHKFKVHQIVWLLCTGEFPALPIDHVDRDRRNNRIENLRLATDAENGANNVVTARPLAGVRKDPKGHGYRADLSIGGKKKYLGYFKTAEDAHAAYVAATREARGEFSPV